MMLRRSMMGAGNVVKYLFDGNINDSSGSNNHGSWYPINNTPLTFVNGRKGLPNTAIQFNADGLLATNNNIDLSNTNAVTTSFWINTQQTTVGVFYEHSPDVNFNNGFTSTISEVSAGKIIANSAQASPNFNIKQSNFTDLLTSGWTHICIVHDRSQIADNENVIYINGVNYGQYTPPEYSQYNLDLSANFGFHQFFIGGRYGGIAPLIGAMSEFELFDRALTPAEIAVLAEI